MKIGGMVEGVSLTEDGGGGEGFIPVTQMRQVGVGLPPDVRKVQDCHAITYGETGGNRFLSPLVVNRHPEGGGHPADPSEILLMARNDKFKVGLQYFS